jgi:hypothetical protein
MHAEINVAIDEIFIYLGEYHLYSSLDCCGEPIKARFQQSIRYIRDFWYNFSNKVFNNHKVDGAHYQKLSLQWNFWLKYILFSQIMRG